MGKLQNGALVFALSAAMLSGGVLGASAQDDENGPEDGDNPVAAGTIDEGQSLLSQASISLDEAIQAAQRAANGKLGEVDLEYYHGTLIFNVDVGDHDVKVDAASGDVLAVEADD
jgi:uncharacterized membrane protein YkoI